MAFDADRIRKASDQLDQLLKHFGTKDHRHPSVHHTADSDTQKPHGNRPGDRTQETILSSLEVALEGLGDRDAKEKTDYFLRAAGVSSPVVQVGNEFWLAPPNAQMLPERGAGENLEVDEVNITPNTNVGEGLSEQDKLELPGPADSEESKRFLEAAAEHRKNNYEGPVTPRFEQMFGDTLRSKHPKRAPKSYGGITPAQQHKALQAVVAAKKRHKWAPLQHAQAVAAVGNVLQNFSPSKAGHAQFLADLLSMIPTQPDAPGARNAESTAQEAPAQQNAQAQSTRAAEQRRQQEQRAQRRRRRLGQRLEDV